MEKRIFHKKREKGAIALISVFAVTLAVLLLALVLDGGLLYYKAAKLQNAVDAAVVAVAQNINSVDSSENDVAKKYLRENGFDADEYGDAMKIDIKKKAYLKDAAEEYEYMSNGAVKLTVEIQDNGLFSAFSGFDELKLKKTGYAKCDIAYDLAVPKALKYTIFGGSTKQVANPKDMTVQINGRASDTLTQITKIFEDSINWINRDFIQPIGAIFGHEPDYGTLTSWNLSNVITNGDIYSNSDINVGAQAINVSRIKDEGAPDDVEEETDWIYDDYGQVTYSAVGKIKFSNVAGSSTHVFLQNQQYLEQTQVALFILKQLDLANINNLDDLKSAYTERANQYFDNFNVALSSQRAAVLAQADNLAMNGDGTFKLNNQKMIVYNISQNLANTVLEQLENGSKTEADLLGALENETGNYVDKLFRESDPSKLVYAQYGDKPSTTKYDVQFDSQGLIKAEVDVSVANRNLHDITTVGASNKSAIPDFDKNYTKTVRGYEYAVAKTFRPNSDYINVPNMKPYFIRQIYRAVANATTSKEDAKAGKVNGRTTVKNAVVDMSRELVDLVDKKINKYSKNEYDQNVSAFDDQTYTSDTALTAKATSPLFRYNYDGTNLTTYDTDDNGHIKFNGENLYDSNNMLKTPDKFIQGFSVDNYANAINVFKNANITGKISNDAVITAKNNFKNNKSYNVYNTNSVLNTSFNQKSGVPNYDAPDEKQVFLSGASDITILDSAPYGVLKEKLDTDTSSFTPRENLGSVVARPDTSVVNPAFPDPTVKVGERTYKVFDIINDSSKTASIISDYDSDHTWTTHNEVGFSSFTDSYFQWVSKDGKTSGGDRNYWWTKTNYNLKGQYFKDFEAGIAGARKSNTGLYIRDNQSMYFTKYVATLYDYNQSNSRDVLMHTSSTLLVGGGDTYNHTNAPNCALANAYRRIEYAGDNSAVVVNGSASVGGIYVGNNVKGAVLIVNGDLYLHGYQSDSTNRIYIGSNAEITIIVTGTIYTWADLGTLPANCIIAADAFKQPDNTRRYIGTNNGTMIIGDYSTTQNFTNNGTVVSNTFTVQDFTNNGYFYGKSTVTANKLVNSSNSNFVTEGNVNITYVDNSGVVKTTGAINCGAGNYSQTEDENSWTIANSLAATNAYLTKGKVVISQNVNISNDLLMGNDNNIVYIEGSITANNVEEYTGGALYVGGDINATNVKFYPSENCVVGNINATHIDIAPSSSDKINVQQNMKVVVNGAVSAVKITNRGTLYLRGAVSAEYVHNFAGAVLICNGSMTVTSNNTAVAGHTSESVTNYGEMYINGDLSAKYSILNENAKLYVKGDVTAATDTANNRVLTVKGANNAIYISGTIASDANGEVIIDSAVTNTVLSVYGYGNKKAIDGTVTKLENNSANSTVYLGTGTGWQGIEEHRVIKISGSFKNNGKMFVYGNLEITCADPEFKGNDQSKTICAFDIDTKGNWLHIDGGHTVKAYNTLTCGGIQLEGYSKLYGVDKLEIANTGLNIWDQGLVFYGPSSNVNGKSFVIKARNDFKGYLYIGGENKSYSIKFVNASDKATNFSAGKFVTEASVSFDQTYELKDNSLIYIGGKANLNDKIIKNSSGELYLINGATINTANVDFTYNNGCTNFIGPVNTSTSGDTACGSYSTSGGFFLDGNNYIQNTIIVGNSGCPDVKNSEYIPNRGEAVIVRTGKTHMSGHLNCSNNDGRGLYVSKNTELTCNALTINSSIYNLGNLFINDNLVYNNNRYYSDKSVSSATDSDLKLGYSIRNYSTNAKMYIGGTSPVTIGGSLQNYGELYSNAGITINGYNVPDLELRVNTGEIGSGDSSIVNRYTRRGSDNNIQNKWDNAPRYSIDSRENSKLYFRGNVSTTGIVYTFKNATMYCGGNLGYGMAILNGGDFIVRGSVGYSSNRYGINHIELFAGSDTKKGAITIVNGFVDCRPNGENAVVDQNRNAKFYAGFEGIPDYDRHLVLGVDGSGNDKQSGSVINWGDMYINASLTINANEANAYNITGLVMQQNSKLFANGYFYNTEATRISDGCIMMCNGDFNSKRCTKIGISEINGNTDNKRATYVYVNGSMNPNISGDAIDKSTYKNTSADLDICTNANVYVKGRLDASKCIICNKQNVTLAIDGKGFSHDNYTFATKQFDQKGNMSQFNRLIVRGDAYVQKTTKFRDMCKGYIYGDFHSGQYVELGKSLDDKDDTEAKEAPFFVEGVDKHEGQKGFDYKFTNAGELFVKGNFYSGGYTRIYAGTTLRVGGKFTTVNYLTLRHDASIYVKESLTSDQSIEGGSYSDFYVGGTMKALGITNILDSNRGTIKIRDCANVFVGDNMTALRYVELGKAGDYLRTEVVDNVGEGEDIEDGSTGTGGEDGGYGESSGEEAVDTTDNNAVNTQEELLADTSDSANGGVFFIGKSLVSYTGYIKEFAFSRVVVGNYVFSPKYITLRHNADLWVMPETFNNTTYRHVAYVSESDGTIIGNIIDKVKETAYNIKDALSLKTGSIYTLGELTLNRNSSVMGTYDAIALGQCVLRPDTLIYVGHDFRCSANSVNLSFDAIKGNESIVGFDTYGEVKTNGGVTTSYPVVIYANNEIDITTTVDMKLTYLIANNGDVKLYDVYSNSNNANGNLTQLPNAICSFNKDVDYFAMYGKIAALFFAPNGTVDLDGYYQEIWGCVLGDNVKLNTYYLALHRFTNWKTMDLKMANVARTYLISEKAYNDIDNNVDSTFLYSTSTEDEKLGGAYIFFPGGTFDEITTGNDNLQNNIDDNLGFE